LAVSFVKVAVIESVREVVSPPRFGLTATEIEPPPEVVVADATFEYPLRFPAASAARTR
jgi:hypothetical protein